MGYKIDKGFMWVRGPKLPAEYQEVEYIESSGTQYIDTGYIITPNTEVTIDFKYTNGANQDMIFGVGSDSLTSTGITFCSYIGSGSVGVISYSYGLSNGTTSNSWNNSNISTDTNRYKHIMNSSSYKMYDTQGNIVLNSTPKSTISTNATHSFGLFCWWETSLNGWRNITSATIYSCTVTDNGIPQRDFVPCYRKSDNTIGMYDKVEGKFYTNAGTGTFTKGNDVAPTYVFKEKQFYPGAEPKPSVLFEIETDFRNYSNISDVYALGWGAGAKGSMSPAVNSTYGFYCGNYTSYRGGQWLYYDISSYMANAKKIYAHLTGYMPGGYTYQANERIVLCNISRIDGNGETTASEQFTTELKGGNYNSNTCIQKVVSGSGTKLVDYGSSNYTGDVDITFEINLESGLVTSVITQPASISMQYTLSASEIAWIKSTLKFIDFAFTTYATGINNYIKTAHIKIE